MVIGTGGRAMKCIVLLDGRDRNHAGRLTPEGRRAIDGSRLARLADWPIKAATFGRNAESRLYCVAMPGGVC